MGPVRRGPTSDSRDCSRYTAPTLAPAIFEPERPDLSLLEEELPRSGLRLVRQVEHTRWVDGATFLWPARRKGAGVGEGSSGLRFDRIEDV